MHLLFLGWMVGFLASFLGWQINLIALHRGIENSRRACFLTGMGACAGDLLYIALAAFGSDYLLRHPEGWSLFKWLGVVLLLFSSYQMFVKGGGKEKSLDERRKSAHRHFLIGVFIVLGNPFLFVLWVGINGYLHPFVKPFLNLFGIFQYSFGFILGCSVWFAFLTFYVLRHVRSWKEEAFGWFSKVTAASLLLAAIFLIFEKI